MRKSTNNVFSLSLILYLFSVPYFAQAEDQSPDSDLFAMSLEDVLDTKVEVSSRGLSKESIRKAAGSVVVFDYNFIQASGVRDLSELILLLPGAQLDGFPFGLPKMNLGSTLHYLLIIDGQDMTDRSLGLRHMKDMYPASVLDRVEIIKGPGSVTYGRTAVAGVILVTTRKPKTDHSDFHGSASTNLGATSDGLARHLETLTASVGSKDEFFTVQGAHGENDLGTGRYEDWSGDSIASLHDTNSANPR